MTYTELCEKKMKDSWSFVKAAPCGLITSREQYDYMVAYSEKTNFGFYIKGSYDIPTYRECYDKYLSMTSFFGGASFYFTITDLFHEYVNGRLIAVPKKWDYGKYGKIDLEK